MHLMSSPLINKNDGISVSAIERLILRPWHEDDARETYKRIYDREIDLEAA